jgi:hypothetical protein
MSVLVTVSTLALIVLVAVVAAIVTDARRRPAPERADERP